MAVQTTYNQTISPAVAGMRADMELTNDISRIVEDAAGIGFGLLVVQGTGANGVKQATILGVSAGAASAIGTNTGNGTVGTITPTAGAVAGQYTIEFDDATHYVVTDPTGAEIGHGTTGVAFSANNVGFTITAGGTAYVPGDSLKFTVTQSGGGVLRGITVRDETLAPTSGDVYPQYSTAAIKTRGVIWVIADATVSVGNPVWYNPTNGRWSNVAGTTNVPVPDAIFDSAAVSAGLVQLRYKI